MVAEFLELKTLGVKAITNPAHSNSLNGEIMTSNNRYVVRGVSASGVPYKVGAASSFAKAVRIAKTQARLLGTTPRIFNEGRECIFS
jgi:hypothetical protein